MPFISYKIRTVHKHSIESKVMTNIDSKDIGTSQSQKECSDLGKDILDREKELAHDLISFFKKKNEAVIVQSLKQVESYLSQPFMIVIVGEFNSGKSAMINALLGRDLLKMDVTPTTDKITILSTADQALIEGGNKDEGIMTVTVEHPRLEALAIVDTPGTNSLIDRHQQLTEKFIPRADLIIFVSSCQQPLTASERYFLSLVHKDWKRKLIFVLNKMDLLDETELEKVVSYTRHNLKELVLEDIEIIPIAAKVALNARMSKNEKSLQSSNLQSLEEIIFNRLGTCDKWKLKLHTPLMTFSKHLETFSQEQDQLEKSLNQELEAVKRLETQSVEWMKRTKELSQAYIPAVETPFFRFEQNCNKFLDQKMNILHLARMKISGIPIEKEFQAEVFDDPLFKDEFEKAIGSAVQFLMKEIQRFQHDSLISIDSMIEKYASKNREFQSVPDYKRLALQSQIRESESFRPSELNTSGEAQKIKESISQAVVNFVGVEAISGSVVAVTLATALSDVTGILLAAILAGLGFAILPRKKARLKREFSGRIRDIAAKVQESLLYHIDRKIEESINDFKTALTPYVSLCQSELSDINTIQQQLNAFQQTYKLLYNDINLLSDKQPSDKS